MVQKRERRAAIAVKRAGAPVSPAPLADFVLADHGSVAVLTPMTDAGREWRDEHLPSDAASWGRGVVIEPRYLAPILEGIACDGLEIAA
jgi:hypothetical protein